MARTSGTQNSEIVPRSAGGWACHCHLSLSTRGREATVTDLTPTSSSWATSGQTQGRPPDDVPSRGALVAPKVAGAFGSQRSG